MDKKHSKEWIQIAKQKCKNTITSRWTWWHICCSRRWRHNRSLSAAQR